MAEDQGGSQREQPKKKLTKFEGVDVLSATVQVTNAGDGLSKAMKVDPIEMHHGQTGVIAIEYEVAKVRFDPIDDTDGLQRVHILRAGRATLIDPALVQQALDEQQDKIDEALGNMKLGLLSDEQIDGLMSAHADGLHDGIAEDGCPSCAERDALAKAEADAAAKAKKAEKAAKKLAAPPS